MVNKIYIVVGLGYGDEGKGMTTDRLCINSKKPIVVRFNGGHQAGHTVATSSGKTHIFASFGSGSLRDVPTYWSKFCTLSPSVLVREYKELLNLSIRPKIFINHLCPVTTHYDILYNQAIETTRGNSKHGSCGVGFGSTVERHTSTPIKFFAQDLQFPSVYVEKLKAIRLYYQDKIDKKTDFNFDDFNHDEEDLNLYLYIDEMNKMLKDEILFFCSDDLIFNSNVWETVIFEGAQGVLLDMNFGVFPYVTYSNTTSYNAHQIIAENLVNNIDTEVVYVTRCYQTRHGAGPFNRNSKLKLNSSSETNKTNSYQGDFHIDYLDIDNLNYAIQCDSNYSNKVKKSLVITCLDNIDPEAVICKLGQTTISTDYREISRYINCKFESVKYSFTNIS